MSSKQSRQAAWGRYLSDQRIAVPIREKNEGRSPFDRDHDRVIFSDAFRRLADKTQVFPMAEHDHTRTRLTHSLEVSCVGRSLGTMAGGRLLDHGLLPDGLQPADVGTIVATACLAHDIGNPPFGHAGEQSIQDFFAGYFEEGAGLGFDKGERRDLEAFEGNAQGFRLLTRLIYRRQGGMRPTVATLGAMVKYPRGSRWHEAKPRNKAYKKHGFFQADLEMARDTFAAFGPSLSTKHLGYARHPLAFLSEAADDICYMIIDLEDAVRLRVVNPADAHDLMRAFLDERDRGQDLSALRAKVIHSLTMGALTAFEAQLGAIEGGRLERALIDITPYAKAYDALQAFSLDYIYQSERVLEVESAGHEAIDGLLGLFVPAILATGAKQSAHQRRLVNLIPVDHFRVAFPSAAPPANPVHAREVMLEGLSAYQRLLVVTDYLSGLTDSLVVDLYQKLKGMKLPSR